MWWDGFWDFGFPGWPWALFGMLWMIAFWGAIIGIIIWAITRFTGGARTPRVDDPLEIAKARYARGEITRDQFEQIRRDIA